MENYNKYLTAAALLGVGTFVLYQLNKKSPCLKIRVLTMKEFRGLT